MTPVRVAFAECTPHYDTYLAPYQIWGFLEAGETPADAFALGMLPSNGALTRFYLTRSVRIALDRYRETGAVRRVRRRCAHLTARYAPRAELAVGPSTVDMCLRYMATSASWASRRSRQLDAAGLRARLDGPMTTHLLAVDDSPTNRPVGLAALYVEPPIAYYAIAWLDETYRAVYLGKYLKILAIQHAIAAGLSHLYFGTCYSEGALYKTEFAGVEFFDGVAWSNDRARLRLLLREQSRLGSRHLFEHPAFLAEYPAPGPDDAAWCLGRH